ncbi:hypothetical protein GCM10009539_75080 [Cryptosporangium japonicum]|uniref:Uncharacterized protein n=1 Tax=Cryptosporangium japonicum TaxID=80872 RepID=A0ABN0V5Q3_9ACTN
MCEAQVTALAQAVSRPGQVVPLQRALTSQMGTAFRRVAPRRSPGRTGQAASQARAGTAGSMGLVGRTAVEAHVATLQQIESRARSDSDSRSNPAPAPTQLPLQPSSRSNPAPAPAPAPAPTEWSPFSAP